MPKPARFLIPMKHGIACLLSLAALAGIAAAQADDAQKCAQDASANPNLAIDFCSAAIQRGRLSPMNLATTYNNRGGAYILKGDFDAAIKDFDQAIQLMPDYALAFKNRGIAYGNKGNYDLAIEDFGQAILLKPDDAGAFNSRGIAYGTKGDYDRAIRNFDQAIQLQPGFADAYNNRGNAYESQGDFDRAIADFGQAIRLDSRNVLALKNRAVALYLKGQFDGAILDYDAAIKLTPNDPVLFRRRASAYWGKENYSRALQDFDQAIKLNPRDSAAFRGRGITHFYLAQYDAARQDAARAVQLDPTDAYSAVWLYISQAKLGQDPKADLTKNASALKSEWPLAVVQFYLGRGSPQEVFRSAKDPNPLRNMYQLCEAYFYLGEDALIRGRLAEARDLFQKTIATGITSFFEYHAAAVELDRMKSQ